MKRISRNRQLAAEEAAKYKAIREQVAEELPDLIARHHNRNDVVNWVRERREMFASASAVLQQVRPRLAEAFGDRLRGVVLFGSEARGDAAPDSDIDLLVLLQGPIDVLRDIRTAVDALYPLQLEFPDRPLQALPADIEDYEAGTFAVYRHAKREGILL